MKARTVVILGIVCWIAAAICGSLWWILMIRMAKPGNVVNPNSIN